MTGLAVSALRLRDTAVDARSIRILSSLLSMHREQFCQTISAELSNCRGSESIPPRRSTWETARRANGSHCWRMRTSRIAHTAAMRSVRIKIRIRIPWRIRPLTVFPKACRFCTSHWWEISSRSRRDTVQCQHRLADWAGRITATVSIRDSGWHADGHLQSLSGDDRYFRQEGSARRQVLSM